MCMVGEGSNVDVPDVCRLYERMDVLLLMMMMQLSNGVTASLVSSWVVCLLSTLPPAVLVLWCLPRLGNLIQSNWFGRKEPKKIHLLKNQ